MGSAAKRNMPYSPEGPKDIDYGKLLDRIVSTLPEAKRSEFRALIEQNSQPGQEEALHLSLELVGLMNKEKMLEAKLDQAKPDKKQALYSEMLPVRERIQGIKRKLEAKHAGGAFTGNFE